MSTSLGKNRSTAPALKICGLKDPAQALAIASLGVQAIGVIGVPATPRYLADEQRRTLFQSLEQHYPALKRVWVIANLEPASIHSALTGAGTPNVVQLHGDESIAQVQQFKRSHPETQCWKALRVRSQDDLAAVERYAAVADAVLLDAWAPGQLGGTGHRLPLHWIDALTLPCPWWLAGGVSSEWIPELLSQTNPDGLDASSKLETSPGDKDLNKVQALIEAVAGFRC